ncbi:MAG: hypothetical protein ABR581_00940 [Thermoleophilaceae bacterium]
MSGFWAVFWLAVVLKIPIVGLLGIVWWAVKAQPEPEHEPSDGDGGSRQERHPRGRPPRLPRRGGPHAAPLPSPPARVRANGRPLERTHR